VGVPNGPTIEEGGGGEGGGGGEWGEGGEDRVGERLLMEALEQRKISWSFRK
jgi:hypothetical protein